MVINKLNIKTEQQLDDEDFSSGSGIRYYPISVLKTAEKWIVLMLILTIFSCKIKPMEKKYEWSAAISAPEVYPIEVIYGRIGTKGGSGTSFGTIYGVNNPGWGEEGGSMDNSYVSELPNQLQFTYYSFVEDKYYTGVWALDTAYLHEVFAQIVFNIRKIEKNPNTFIIGLGPKGKVVLWTGGNSSVIEVGSFLAKDTVITAADMGPDDAHRFEKGRRESFLTDTFYINAAQQKEIRAHGYPDPNLYNLYQNKYNYTIEFNTVGQPTDCRMFYVNGEFETKLHGQEDIPFFKTKAIVDHIFYSSEKEGIKYFNDVYFESFEELNQAFAELSLNKLPMILKININETQGICTVYLENANRRIQINNVLIENGQRKIE